MRRRLAAPAAGASVLSAESTNRPVLELALTGDSLRLRRHYEVQHSPTALGLVAEAKVSGPRSFRISP